MVNAMRKNIILLDREGALLSHILQYTDFHIVVLVCEFHAKTKPLIESYKERITHCLDYQNLLQIQHSTHIDYTLIEAMKPIQIDVETMLHRVMLNNPLAKDIYYQYLSFFAQIFTQYHLYFVLNAEAILATPHHLIPFGLAKAYNIPAYTFEGILNDVAILHYNTRTCIKFDPYQKPASSIKQRRFYAYETHIEPQENTLKAKLTSLLYKLGGSILVEFIVCLKQRSFKRKFMGIEYNYFSKLYSFIQHKRMHRFYKTHACKPSLKEKFIYFNLHLEPEAAIIGRAILEAQLTLIKMTARALPEGYKLYVKEHPHQLQFNDNLTDYFLHNITFFKNIAFYKHIMQVPNTSLLSLEISAKELISHSQAIATFDGTVTLEAIAFNKPVILFNAPVSPYQFLSHTYHIYAYKDLQNAISHITQNPPKILNEDEEFARIEPYMSNTQHKDFYSNLLSSITKHIQSLKGENYV